MKTNKNIVIVLNAEFPFIPSSKNKNELKLNLNSFFNLLSYTYLPLLRMCYRLENESIPFAFTIAFEGTLCEMLSNKKYAKMYVQHLDKQIEFCAYELNRCKDDKNKLNIINTHKEILEKNLEDFIKCDGMILSEFDKLAQKGYIEILATTATTAFLPFYADMPEAIAAQIETGKLSYRNFFSSLTSGFWLPGQAGYINGLEKIVRSYGFDYTILDTKAFLFSESIPSYGIFSPAMTDSNLAVFARDLAACNDVTAPETAYFNSSTYLDTSKDIGFELSEEYLSKLFTTSNGRRHTGFKYYSKAGNNTIYDIQAASKQAKIDADDFLAKRLETLKQVENIVDSNVPLTSVSTINIDFLEKKWAEGLQWLEQLFRSCAKNTEIKCSLPNKILKDCKQIENISPFFSSLSDDGYAGQFLNNDNDFMYQDSIKITERMIDLTKRFPNDVGLKQRVLNIATREVLLAQSTIWTNLANTSYGKEYAEKQFNEHVMSFNLLYESLGSGVISTKLLSSREQLYPIFSEINYHSFAEKK